MVLRDSPVTQMGSLTGASRKMLPAELLLHETDWPILGSLLWILEIQPRVLD